MLRLLCCCCPSRPHLQLKISRQIGPPASGFRLCPHPHTGAKVLKKEIEASDPSKKTQAEAGLADLHLERDH